MKQPVLRVYAQSCGQNLASEGSLWMQMEVGMRMLFLGSLTQTISMQMLCNASPTLTSFFNVPRFPHPDPTFHTPTLDSASETISDPFDEKGCSKLRRCRFRRVAVPLTQVWRHPCLLCNGGLLTFWIQYLLFPPPRYILPPKPLTSHSIRHTMIVYKQ